MNKKLIFKGIFLGKTKTKNGNFFIDFLLKNSKIKTIFCNKLDYQENINLGSELKVVYKIKNKVNIWIIGDIKKLNKNKSSWFICFNEWIRQILQTNKINSIYKLYLLSKKIEKDEETSTLINIFLKLLKKIGYSFNLKSCNICKNKIEMGFINLDEGGILCFFCKKNEKQTFHLTSLIENINRNKKNNNISIFQDNELKLFLNNIVSFINNRCGFYKKLNY